MGIWIEKLTFDKQAGPTAVKLESIRKSAEAIAATFPCQHPNQKI